MENQICDGIVGFTEESSKAKPPKKSKKKRPIINMSPEDEGELDKNLSPQQLLIAIQPHQLSATPSNT